LAHFLKAIEYQLFDSFYYFYKKKIMKNILLTSIFSFLFTISIVAQESKLPNVVLKDLEGKSINVSKLENNGKPIIINFWATWCSPCKRELNAIADLYTDWQKETGVKLIAVSVDDQRTVDRVKPYVNGSGWEYDFLLDTNADLKRAMGVNNVPFTFLVDGNGNIVYKHNNYNPGDEYKLYDKILELTKKK